MRSCILVNRDEMTSKSEWKTVFDYEGELVLYPCQQDDQHEVGAAFWVGVGEGEVADLEGGRTRRGFVIESKLVGEAAYWSTATR
jgi:hypothetical protein